VLKKQKIIIAIFLILFCNILFAAPVGNRPCIITYLYVGNNEKEADAVFERYTKELIKKGWHEGITNSSGFEGYNFIFEYFYLLYCDSIKTEGIQITNEKFGVTLMNFNNKILLLTWFRRQESYYFYKTYLP
jgi:hypothetical protein